MYCSKCGKQIDDEAVFCPGCGYGTENYNNDLRRAAREAAVSQQSQNEPTWHSPDYIRAMQPPPVTVVNNNTVSASATAYATTVRMKRHHSVLFDVFMICITGGLWIIWMIFRPKYY